MPPLFLLGGGAAPAPRRLPFRGEGVGTPQRGTPTIGSFSVGSFSGGSFSGGSFSGGSFSAEGGGTHSEGRVVLGSKEKGVAAAWVKALRDAVEADEASLQAAAEAQRRAAAEAGRQRAAAAALGGKGSHRLSPSAARGRRRRATASR